MGRSIVLEALLNRRRNHFDSIVQAGILFVFPLAAWQSRCLGIHGFPSSDLSEFGFIEQIL